MSKRPDLEPVTGAQNISRMCLVCGAENSAGLQGRFLELRSGELAGVFLPQEEHQSYPGRLHGGISAAMLDETIGRAINVGDPGSWGVTVELSVRFRRPVPLDGEVRAIGRITEDLGRMFKGTGELLLEDGTIAVEASGTYLRMPIERIVEGEFEREWFADPRPAPEGFERPSAARRPAPHVNGEAS